jgi:pSer/pThr/pTyr-binding forkhead associated (FHA) protein
VRAEPPAAWGTLIAVRRDGSDGERFPLVGDWLEVGRDSDLSFDDRFLAARHARFDRSSGAPTVLPIDALNGVFRRLRAPVPLEPGALLLGGRELLRYEPVEPDEREVAPQIRLGVVRFGSPPRRPWGRLLQVLASGGVRDVRHLALPEIVLGREEGELIFRDDEFLSRRHLALRFDGTRAVVEDLGSSNGTFVRLRGPAPLVAGDVLRMGDQMFRFEPIG